MKKGSWGKILRYTVGATVCLLAGISLLIGSHWFFALSTAVAGGIIILGGRRIFRVAVRRSGDEIVCRYIPWYEGNAYVVNLLVPLMGIASLAAGYTPGNPAWLRLAGIFLLALTPLLVYSAVRMWRRCFLRITPSALTVGLAVLGSRPIDIRRDLVQSVEPKLVPSPVASQSRQVEITYQADDSSDTTKTVMLGPSLSVQPTNLLNALVAWKDGTLDNPSELLDRIEQILRGRSTARL